MVTLEHDACGRVVQRTVARNGFRPQTWRFDWNAQDQLVSGHCPDGDVWAYAYAPLGRRISKACKHTKVTFIWDGDVVAREITETRGETQTVDWFFEPGSFRPMARLEGGDLTFVINDHLGTPKEVVGGDGSLRWSAEHDTWGTLRTKRAVTSAPAETGDYWVEPMSSEGNLAEAYVPNPDTFYCSIRFQGQWEDAETGLYFNRFRYYDPKSAQYIGPDPVRIDAGPRLHSYVPTPTKYFDAYGLSCCCWAGETNQYLYRGVRKDHPEYTNALSGRTVPGDIANINGVTPTSHNFGGVSGISPYTSWTRDPSVAGTFAGSDGVVMRVPVGAPSSADNWNWEFSDDVYGESEVLLQGIREGAEVFDRRKCG